MRALADGDRDDRSYPSSWGASNREFHLTTDEEKLRMLLAKALSIAVVENVDRATIHQALLLIPEYCGAFKDIARYGMIPSRYREAD